MRTTTARAGGALAALCALALLAACGGGGPQPLASRSCQADDLPETFERLAFGNLARDDLARQSGAEALADAEGGYFAFWKERIADPGDETARELVCQIIAFGDDARASRFTASLRPDRESLGATVAGVPIAAGATVREVAPPDAGPDGARAFRLEERGALVRHAVVAANGRVVLSVHLSGEAEAETLARAAAILASMVR